MSREIHSDRRSLRQRTSITKNKGLMLYSNTVYVLRQIFAVIRLMNEIRLVNEIISQIETITSRFLDMLKSRYLIKRALFVNFK